MMNTDADYKVMDNAECKMKQIIAFTSGMCCFINTAMDQDSSIFYVSQANVFHLRFKILNLL